MHVKCDEVSVCRSKTQRCGDEGFCGGGMGFNWAEKPGNFMVFRLF